jgi:hypothetical protein
MRYHCAMGPLSFSWLMMEDGKAGFNMLVEAMASIQFNGVKVTDFELR